MSIHLNVIVVMVVIVTRVAVVVVGVFVVVRFMSDFSANILHFGHNCPLVHHTQVIDKQVVTCHTD